MPPQENDILTVQTLHADGQCFRSWTSRIEQVTEAGLIMLSVPGHDVEDVKGNWVLRNYIRSYFWFDRPYNVLEVYEPDGTFIELYMNVASPPTLEGDTLTWTDHELDVSKLPGQPARIVDQDEFADAAIRYRYSPEFQAHCHVISEELRQLAERWMPAGLKTNSRPPLV